MAWVHFLVTAFIISAVDIYSHKIRKIHLTLAIATFLPFIDLDSLVHAAINFVLYKLLYVVSRRRIGYGDVRLSLLIGLYSGTFFDEILHLFSVNLATWIIAGTFVSIRSRRTSISRQNRLPFAPFMFLGVITTFLVNQ